MLITEILRKKRFGGELTRDELAWFLQKYLVDEVKDYQVAAWLMAVCIRGMSERETRDLTLLMRDSGRVFQFPKIKKFIVDKHSTGGVGDKTSLIIAPIVAAAGLAVPMVAGRGLGHTGGTLDKLETIPGFRVDLSPDRFADLIASLGFAIMGQTQDMCPADKKLYALRDVTGTVDSHPLICASIMSKKLAEGLNGLVLDVKFGSGAFMKTVRDAETLARSLKQLGESSGIQVKAVLSNMGQPLGRYIGNAFEVIECLDILSGQNCVRGGVDFYEETRKLSLELSAHMIQMAEPHRSVDECRSIAEGILVSGKALENFEKMCFAQGKGLPTDMKPIYAPTVVPATVGGYIASMNTELIGLAAVELGCGRKTFDQKVDGWAGIEMMVKVGQTILPDQPLAYVFGSADSSINNAVRMIRDAIQVTPLLARPSPLIAGVL